MKTLRRLVPWALLALAVGLEAAHAGPTVTFVAAAAALLPFAGLMGRATEHLAITLGAGAGGLLNASFGNAAELILAFVALREGMTEVVKASITGSIVGNSLLVLGLAVVAGGLKRPIQTFNATAAGLGSTLLALSAAALLLPATFHHIAPSLRISEERMSVLIGAILFAAYVLSLIFSLKTHKHLYAGEDDPHEGPVWSRKLSVAVLAVATAAVAVLSEVLVGQVEHMSKAFGLNEVFVGVMVVAVLGNAAEHSTAIVMAYKSKMDVALGIAVGSSTQVALFVAPVLVFAGQLIGKPLDLVFSLSEVVAVGLSAWIVALVSHDGQSHWMEGVLLLALYAILGVTIYFLPA
ncbi:MAG: calcium/proton exchanger [Planctomycetes bacterium]|nr:calcium/proton exchanger [Planctomycetota bacterium]